MNKVKLFYHPILWLVIYLSMHLLVRMLLSTTLQVDDAEQIDYAQDLLLGYPIPQPPMYSWLSWIMFQLLGTSLLALTLLKYLLIALTFWLTWLVSGQLFQHLQTRYLATFSYLLMPSFAWHMHQGFTHTILLGFGIILSLHALLSLKENPNTKNYLYLGLALGVGLMGKYSFLLFALPLLAAALSISNYRNILANIKILLSIGVFLLVIGPHLYWLLQHHQEVFASIDQKLQVSNGSVLLERLNSVGRFVGAALAFVLPFALVFLIGAWKQLFNHDRQLVKNDNVLLLSHFYWVIIISVALLAIFVSMPHFKVRWFHPLMMIFPLWMLIRIERKQLLSKTLIRWFYGSVILLSVLILSIRIAQVTIGPELGKYGRLNRPIVETLDKLPDALTQNAILKTEDGFIGSHLLIQYPSQTVVIEDRHFQIHRQNQATNCLWLWDDDTPYTIPNIKKTLDAGSITTHVAEFSHTLFYALSPAEECYR